MLSPRVPPPVILDTSVASVTNPDNHQATLVVQLLLRVASSANDEQIQKAEELRHEWQKNLILQAKSDTGGSTRRKKTDTAPKLTLLPEQAYHAEILLPCEDSMERPADKQYKKFFLDIISLQYMAKVFYGSVSDMPGKNPLDDTSAKLFRYFRRNGCTYCFIEVEFEWMITESVIRRLATHTASLDIYDSADKLSMRAKTDYKASKKMALPRFHDFSLSAVQARDWTETVMDDNKTDAKKAEWLGTRLAEQYLSDRPALSIQSEPAIFPVAEMAVQTILPGTPALAENIPVSNFPATPLNIQPAVSKKGIGQKAKQEQLAAKLAKRKVESSKTPVITFPIRTSRFFLPTNLVLRRGIMSTKIGPANDENTELISSLFDGFCRMAIKNGDFLSLGQQVHLNPLTLSFQAVNRLPDKPVSFSAIEKICHPVFIQFNRFGLERFRTSSQPQAADMEWHEPVVTFMNQMDPELLKELLLGPSLELQVHDRDRKDGVCDNSFGVAKLDLYPLFASNLKDISYEIPVLPYVSQRDNWITENADDIAILKAPNPDDPTIHAPVKDSKETKKAAKRTTEKTGAVGNGSSGKAPRNSKGKDALSPRLPKTAPVPPGRYQDAKTVLKVQVSVACPLRSFIDSSPPTGSTPFSRYALILPADKTSDQLVASLCSLIEYQNAKALNLTDDQRMRYSVQNDLMTFPSCLTEVIPDGQDHEEDHPDYNSVIPEFDFNRSDTITGFHLSDGHVNIVVVEGLCEKALKTFAAYIDENLVQIDVSKSTFLWDSSLRFSKRLYGEFGPCLFPLRITKSLRYLARKSYLHMAKIFPPSVPYTLHQLYRMVYSTKEPRDLLKNRLYPSVAHLRDIRIYLSQVFEVDEHTEKCS